MTSIPYFISYVTLSVILVSTFISIFFFTYVSKVEEEIVKTQMDNIVVNLIKDLNLWVSPEFKNILRDSVNKMKSPETSQEDDEVLKSNNKLLIKSIKVFGIVFCIGIFLIWCMWYKYRFNIKEIVLYNLIMICFVALTYFLFLISVPKNYNIIDVNHVKYMFLVNLKNWLNK